MSEHITCWTGQVERGTTVVMGPVLDPKGAYGIGVVEVEDEAGLRAMLASDPGRHSGPSQGRILSDEPSFHRAKTKTLSRRRGAMNPITDDYMRETLKTRKPYTIVILRNGPKVNEPDADKLIWEHGRRNFELRRDGKLCIVCMVTDESEVAGLEIFRTDLDETRRLVEEDVAVRAGILTYEIHPVKSFPGDALAR